MKGLRAFQLGTVAAIAVVAYAVSAQAADLPSRVLTPVAPVASVPSWTGFYVGVEGGADIATNKYTTTGLNPAAVAITSIPLDNANNADFSQTNPRIGLYLGYNRQIDNYVVGLEGDAAYDFGQTKSTTGIPGTVTSVLTFSATDGDFVRVSSKYDASVRARAGYLITPAILAYATGGVAFHDASYIISCLNNVAPAGSYCGGNQYADHHTTQVGYTVGGGIEGFVAPNLLLRAEYRYSDFGGRSHSDFSGGGLLDDIYSRTHLSSSMATVGLAYKFSMPEPGPLVARY